MNRRKLERTYNRVVRRWMRIRVPFLIAAAVITSFAVIGGIVAAIQTNKDPLETADSTESTVTTEATSENSNLGTMDPTEESSEPVKIIEFKFSVPALYTQAEDEYPTELVVLTEGEELPQNITYSSEHPEIAEIDENGVIRTVSPGKTLLHASANGHTAELRLYVLDGIRGVKVDHEPIDEYIAAYEEEHKEESEGTETGENEGNEVPEEKKVMILHKKDTFQFTAYPVPSTTKEDYEIKWYTSNDAVGVINEEGQFTAVGAGETEVLAVLGDFRETLRVKVIVPLEGIALSAQNLTIRYGEKLTIPVVYYPGDTTEIEKAEWSCLNDSVLSIDENGQITTKGVGTAQVTATVGKFTASCYVTVVIPITSVSVSQSSVTLNKGNSFQLSAAVNPANTTEEKYINWSSDNASVATVSESGVVTAVGAGTARITAFHDDFAAVCVVSVVTPMSSIQIDQQNIGIVAGFSTNLSVSYFPEDTTDPKGCAWTSSDPEIATVENGYVTAVSPGVAWITAYCNGLSAATVVTVVPYINVESITLNASSLSFGEFGQTAQLSAAVFPANATSTAVTWESSDPNVAVVADGLVRAVGSGDCVITASSGGVSASIPVHVDAQPIVVVLDPGHDSSHTGAYYYDVMEHQISMKVALACKSYLENNFAGVKVYLTRSMDGSCAVGGAGIASCLENRAQVAQNLGASILVSLHFNATGSHTASGALAFVSKQANVAAACNSLGNMILNRICGTFPLQNRGCIASNSDSYFDAFGNPQDYYAINRHCANRGIPGIIVEHCFMDVDAQFCNNDESLNQFGVCDALGIADYLGLQRK